MLDLVIYMNNIVKKIITEICNEENIEYNFISENFVTVLKKNNTIRYLFGYKFDLNNHALGEICDDKFALYDLLKSLNIPVVKHNILFNNNNSYNAAHKLFQEYNNNIVIKPNNGTCGIDVYNINKEKNIDKIIKKLFVNNYSISICPFYEIVNEYRLIVLNNKIVLKYCKYNPKVIGNGKNSIRELLIEFNPAYFQNRLNDKKYDKILKKGKEFTYSWKFNLSGGAICRDINDKDLENKLECIALDIAKKINLKFGSIDIVKTTSDELLILEINSGVMLDNYIKIHKDGYLNAKKIYKKAIINLFK